LRAAGVGLALPMLDRWRAATVAGDATLDAETGSPQRLMFMCTTLGLHGPNFFPTQIGRDFELPKYLEPLGSNRNDFTVFSGLSHPDQSGNDGHASERTYLTSARHPGLSGFQNSISVDQLAAEKLGYTTRFPSINLSTDHGSQSYTRSGVMLPTVPFPSKIFAELFLAGSDKQIRAQIQNLKEGRSILDAVARDARRMTSSSNAEDRQRLQEYFQSVRDLERKLEAAQQWVKRPKPTVDASQPKDIENEADLIGRMELMLDLVPLIFQTDSTRVLTMSVQGRNDVPMVNGVNVDHHNLSHHGQDPAKLEQLQRVEMAQMKSFASLVQRLAVKNEFGKRLLDNTTIMLGSNLGNANSHDWRNLPVLLAGGGFRHGQHIAFDAEDNRPLSDLFVTMLQHQGHEIDAFGSSQSTIEI
jgi:hypothetical protein